MPRIKPPSEHEVQKQLIRVFRFKYPKLADCLIAIPNGGLRHVRVAAKLKAEGVRAGVSDLFLTVPRGDKHGLWLEMKTKGGRLTDHQKDWFEIQERQGYATAVAFTADEGIEKIERYLSQAD